ncbi:hypothetical protein VTG60DRAFT_2844 [Thermothelomyces hinnuleus]
MCRISFTLVGHSEALVAALFGTLAGQSWPESRPRGRTRWRPGGDDTFGAHRTDAPSKDGGVLFARWRGQCMHRLRLAAARRSVRDSNQRCAGRSRGDRGRRFHKKKPSWLLGSFLAQFVKRSCARRYLRQLDATPPSMMEQRPRGPLSCPQLVTSRAAA